MKNIAIITGATSGVGREFVRQFDQGAGGMLDELWLVARSKGDLERVREETALSCRVLPLDLTQESSFDTLAQELEAQDDLRVQWLVNSAGFGRTGTLAEVGRAANAGMVKLNCLAVVEACYAVLPHMGPGSRIVNLASVAGFLPLPRFATYSASKDFVLNFSLALDAELAGTGIHVCALCPKWMKTGFVKEIGNEADYDAMSFIGFQQPSDVVAKALRAAVLGKRMCVPAPEMWLARAATKVLPVGITLGALALLSRRR